MREYFGTDGVRGIVGEFLTTDLVERLGRAATLWCGAKEVFIGRDTRASGVELERAFARGVTSAGGQAILGGVLPTPAVALDPHDLGAVISASHNPAEYNGVKLFGNSGQKLSDEAEEAIEALLDSPATHAGPEPVEEPGAREAYANRIVESFGSDLSDLRVAVDCANGAYSGLGPAVFRRLGADVTAIGDAPDGANINAGCGATELGPLQELVRDGDFDLGIAFDGDGDRMLAVDERGEAIDGDQIVAILALHLGEQLVAVTQMTNLGFHALMAEHGVRVLTTDVGDRYVLEALREEGGFLGGEQSGHIIFLRDHVTGDGLAAALLLCQALRLCDGTGGRTLSEAAAVMPRYAQAKENVSVRSKVLDPAIEEAVNQLNAELAGKGRVLVRPSGTEPLIRVLAEAENETVAKEACVKIAALVRAELG